MRRNPVLVATVLAIGSAALAADENGVSGPGTTIWDGIYTEAQAARGAKAYGEPCGKCHGYGLNGAPDDPDMFSTPPLAGPKFLRDWNGRTLLGLFEYTQATMPANNPGYFTAQELVDVIAYMLEQSGVPPGLRELPAAPAALADVELRAAP